MNNLQENITLAVKNKHFLILCTLIFLVSLNFFIGSEYREILLSVFWNGDDVFHISIADNFRNEKNFEQQYLSMRYLDKSENFFLDLYPNISENPQGSKGPIYYIFLGSFYEILSTSQDDLYLHGSIFNNLLTSIFLILFFFFVKRFFGFKVAIISSIIISFIPGFGQISTRVMIDPLLFIFMLSALFFFERKNHHYVLFGIFSGLSVLTHPISISLLISYFVSNLLQRNFTGFFVSLVTFNVLLFPWLLRNFLVFNDFGRGLYLPFSTSISSFFSNLINVESNITSPSLDQANSFNFHHFFSSKNLILTSTQDIMFHSGILIIFLVIFVSLSFFNFKNFNKKQKYFFLLCLSLFIIFILLISFFEIPFLVIIASLFYIAPILIYIIYRTKKNLFSQNIPKIKFFIILSFFIHFIAITTFAIFSNWPAMGVRYYIFYLILIVPVAVFGLDVFLKNYIRKITIDKKTISFLIVIFFILLIVIDLGYGGHNSLRNQIWIFESSEMKKINETIKKLDIKGNVASNYPEEIWYRTGVNSIQIPTYITNQDNFENFLRTYDIDYIIFYNNIDPRYPPNELKQQISNFPVGTIHYEIFHVGKSSIIRVMDLFDENVLTEIQLSDTIQHFHDIEYLEIMVGLTQDNLQLSDISQPFHYVAYLKTLEDMERTDWAGKLRSVLMEFDSDVKIMQEICLNLSLFQFYDESISQCTKLLENDNNDIFVLMSLENNPHHSVGIEKHVSLYEFLNDRHDQSYAKNLIGYMERYYANLDKFEKVSNSLSFDSRIFDNFNKSFDINLFLPAIIKSEQFDESVEIYDLQIKILTKQIKILKTYEFFDDVAVKEIQLSDVLSKQKKFFQLMDKKKSMYSQYENVLRGNELKSIAHTKLANFNENINEFKLALHHFELALKFEPKNEYLEEKIQVLNSILEYQSLLNCHADPCPLLPP